MSRWQQSILFIQEHLRTTSGFRILLSKLDRYTIQQRLRLFSFLGPDSPGDQHNQENGQTSPPKDVQPAIYVITSHVHFIIVVHARGIECFLNLSKS